MYYMYKPESWYVLRDGHILEQTTPLQDFGAEIGDGHILEQTTPLQDFGAEIGDGHTYIRTNYPFARLWR